MKKILFAACASFVAAAAPLSAAVTVSTTTSGTDPAFDPGYAGYQLIYDFDALSPAAGAITGDYKIEVAPGVSGVSAAPAGTAAGTHFLTVPNSVSNGSATLSLGGNFKVLSFYWGSVDDYNTVDLLDSVGNVLFSISGAGLPAPSPANGNQTAPTTNRRVTFLSDSADIAKVRFSSTQYAFETDSFAGAVPEPATWAMMVGGFGMLGFAARRRAAAKAVLA
jgi:hypothetical protein